MRVTAAIAVSGALLLTGCATTSGSDGPGASATGLPSPAPSAATSAPPPTSSATPLASAISATSAPGTARASIRILTSVGGLDDELIGTGPVVFGTGDADLTWQANAGSSREVAFDGTVALQLDPPAGEWIMVPEGTWIPTLAAGQPLRDLADLREVRTDGSELLDGVETTRLVGWLPAAGHLGGLGINELAVAAIEADPGARVEVTVWVDGTGRIVRIMRTTQSQTDVQASATTDLTDFGMAAQIRDPREE